jgi:2-polyprenyl-6-hydroxyphenyl methylase/3-demethylubiquinone-9 3-methyltransferase
MPGYYRSQLAAERLRACYEIAPPRVRKYLGAEIGVVLERTSPSMRVLELGCGYGRVLERLAGAARDTVGIDTSIASLRLARAELGRRRSVHLLAMDAARLGFHDGAFDLTICIQNGISALGVGPETLLREAVRVTGPGGLVLFSSYSARFWEERLRWFEMQAAHGLIGPIDPDATGDGVIVCRDGFRATTVGPDEFADLAGRLGLEGRVFEVDASSLFCEISVP